MNGINFNDALNEKLKDPEFRKEWEASEAEYQMMRAVINARIRNNLTQKQLAELSGISQADISRIENGNANPSISTLNRLAQGMGMSLKLEFVPA